MIVLGIITAILVVASVGISVLNWGSMPSSIEGQYVAYAIALGVEGAKLFLVPYSRSVWSKDTLIAWSSLVMGLVMTVISVGGIVIWLDNNLTFNAHARADVAQVDAIRDARIKAALVLVNWEKASDAVRVLDKVDVAKVRQDEDEPSGLVLPFDLSDGQRWGLLTSVAVTIDLGGLLLIVIFGDCWRNRRRKEAGPQRDEYPAIGPNCRSVMTPTLKWEATLDERTKDLHEAKRDQVMEWGTAPDERVRRPHKTVDKNLLNSEKSATRAPAHGTDAVGNEVIGVVAGTPYTAPVNDCPEGYRMAGKDSTGTFMEFIQQGWTKKQLIEEGHMEKTPLGEPDPVEMSPAVDKNVFKGTWQAASTPDPVSYVREEAALKPREQELADQILKQKFGKLLPSRNKISKDFGIRASSVKAVFEFLLAGGKLRQTEEGIEVV